MPHKTPQELEEMDMVEVLAAFLTETQAPLSIAGGGNIASWHELRKRLRLGGWHSYEEAVDGLRGLLPQGVETLPPKSQLYRHADGGWSLRVPPEGPNRAGWARYLTYRGSRLSDVLQSLQAEES